LETGTDERLNVKKDFSRKRGKSVSKLTKNYFRGRSCKSLLDSRRFSRYRK